MLDFAAAMPGVVLPTAADHLSDPPGWLFCDGRELSRTDYAGLFAAIGTTWGAGDGSTTFNIPDLRGRSALFAGQGNTAEGGGAGSDRALGASGGTETHTLTAGQMPNHGHSYTMRQGLVDLQEGTGDTQVDVWAQDDPGGSTSSAGGDEAHNNMHPFAVLNALIKT